MEFTASIMRENNLIRALLKQELRQIRSAGTHLMSPCREEQEKALSAILLVRETVQVLLKNIPGNNAQQIWEKVQFMDGVHVQGMISAHRSQGTTNVAFDALSRYTSIVGWMRNTVNENAQELPNKSVRKFFSSSVPKKIDENEVFYEDLLNSISDILVDVCTMRTQLGSGIIGEENRSKFVIDFLYTKVRLEEMYVLLHMHGCFEDDYKHAAIHKCIAELREDYNYIGDIVYGIMHNGSSPTAKTMVKKLFLLTSAIMLSVLEP